MAMAVATLGPKELKLRAQRESGGNEVQRRYGVPVKKISLVQARKPFPDGKAALRKATRVVGEAINAPQMVKQQQQFTNGLSTRAAARVDATQARIAELETEVVTLKRELAKRGSTACPVCTARKEANRLFMAAKRKKRAQVR
jgi:hypothetical protein